LLKADIVEMAAWPSFAWFDGFAAFARRRCFASFASRPGFPGLGRRRVSSSSALRLN
jgi:hypothetical protein